MRKIVPLLLAFLFLSASRARPQQLTFVKGQVIENVPSPSYPGLSHALYIPSNYSPDRKWPVLYCFDPGARGKIPAELFREAAEKYGYLIFSSNNSRSDDPAAPNAQTAKAMWQDSHSWFSVDDRRTYATGFSGGARISWGWGYAFPIAGVIGCGAGALDGKPPGKNTPFVYFGIVGNTDFNYHEMRLLDSQLSSFQIPHRIEFFEGSHEWPPKDLCTTALEWMELQAMKQARLPKNPVFIGELYEKQLQKIAALESDSRGFEAFLQLRNLLEDFAGLYDVTEHAKKVAVLQKTREVSVALERQRKIDRSEEQYRNQFWNTITQILNSEDFPAVTRIKNELRLDHWKEQAEKAKSPEEASMAKRLLELAFIETAVYLPGELIRKKDYTRAIVSLQVSLEIHDTYPGTWYNMACVYSLKGDKKKAIEMLQVAVEKGFSDIQRLKTDPDLNAIRNEPVFNQLVDTLTGQ